MSIVAFDTLKFVEKLEAAGIERPHAKATAEAVADSIAVAELADKADIAAVRAEAAANKTELKNDIAAVRAEAAANKAELKADIAAVKTELKADIAAVEHRLEKKIDGVKLDIAAAQIGTQRFILTTVLSAMVINALVILGAMFGLAKLLGH